MSSPGRVITTLLALVALPLSLQGQTKRIDVTVLAPLVFGTFVASGSGSVVIRPDGTRQFSGVFSPDSTYSPARFDIRILGSRQATIVLPRETTLTNGDGATMRIDAFSSIPNGTITVPKPGDSASLTVGATLNVAAGQAPGAYQGSYLIVFSLAN